MTETFLLDVSKLYDDRVFREYYGNLSGYRREKTDRLKIRKDKNLSLGIGILINRFFEDNFGICEHFVRYSELKNGKPFFADFSNIHFNASHSGDVCICTFSENNTGCDVEKLSENKRLREIAKRFFSEEEQKLLAEHSQNFTESFFRLWTLKESYLKFTGEGLSGLNSCQILFSGNAPLAFRANEKQEVCFKEYRFGEYFISVCSASDNFCESITKVEL